MSGERHSAPLVSVAGITALAPGSAQPKLCGARRTAAAPPVGDRSSSASGAGGRLVTRVSVALSRVLGSSVLGPCAVVLVASLAWPVSNFAAADSGRGGQSDTQTVYLRDCAVCHASDGSGSSRGPTLKGQGAAGVDFVLTTGRMPIATPQTPMRRSSPSYPPDVIRALDEYVATLQPGGPAIPNVDVNAASVSAGGSIYREQCAACHQAAAEGGVLLGQNSPSLMSSTPVQIAEAIRNGPGTMPVFGSDAVPNRDVAALAKYVVALQHVGDPGGTPLGHLGPLPEGAIALLGIGAIVLGLRRIGSRT
jgi:ubiquinol-cytochrome c reductase cytochrome c subunit